MHARLQEKEGFASLVLRLRANGIATKAVLAAIEATPRILFLPTAAADLAWSDRLAPIDCGGFAESPDLVARILEHAGIEPTHKVLDIGTGSGYLAACIGRLSERVITVDRYKTLVHTAQQRFEHLGLSHIASRQADGLRGVSGEGTFDRIIATGSFTAMPRHYVDQLVSGGIMLAPLTGENGKTILMKLTKIGSRFEREDLFEVPYLPMIPGLAAAL